MLSEKEFFRFVEEKVDELIGYAYAQAEAGNSRKDLDELINGYPFCEDCNAICDCMDQSTYKAYMFMSENLSKTSVDFHQCILLWDQGFKSAIQEKARIFHDAGMELTPLQAILSSTALLQEN